MKNCTAGKPAASGPKTRIVGSSDDEITHGAARITAWSAKSSRSPSATRKPSRTVPSHAGVGNDRDSMPSSTPPRRSAAVRIAEAGSKTDHAPSTRRNSRTPGASVASTVSVPTAPSGAIAHAGMRMRARSAASASPFTASSSASTARSLSSSSRLARRLAPCCASKAPRWAKSRSSTTPSRLLSTSRRTAGSGGGASTTSGPTAASVIAPGGALSLLHAASARARAHPRRGLQRTFMLVRGWKRPAPRPVNSPPAGNPPWRLRRGDPGGELATPSPPLATPFSPPHDQNVV
jgi:hypothetical protein